MTLAALQVKEEAGSEGPSTSSSHLDKDAEEVFADDDDDELDMDELNELEASLSKTSIQIPGIEAWDASECIR